MSFEQVDKDAQNIPERIGRFAYRTYAELFGDDDIENPHSAHINRRIGTATMAGVLSIGTFMGWAIQDSADRVNSYNKEQEEQTTEIEACIEDFPDNLAVIAIKHCQEQPEGE